MTEQTRFISEFADDTRTGFVHTVIEATLDAFIGMGSDGRVVIWNHQAELIFGWTAQEAIGQSLGELIVPSDLREAHTKGMAHYQETGDGPVVNKRIKMPALRKSGEVFLVEMAVSVHKTGEQELFFSFIQDVSERQKTETELRDLAQTDLLTGLPNRRHLQQRLQETMTRVARSKRLVAVMFMDIDHFKSINDGSGHEVGDHLLKQFADRLRAAVREVDFLGRLGGDEFMLIAEELNDQQNAAIVAQKIVESMVYPFEILGHSLTISTSIGITLYAGQAIDADTVIRRADQAMYQAKRSGRNTFRFSSEDKPVPPASPLQHVPLEKLIANAVNPESDLDEFLQDSLHAIRTHLDMDVAFISQFTEGNRVFRYVDAKSDSPPIAVGGSGPLEESYCQRVVDGRLPEIIPDAFLNTEAMSIPATRALPVRAHMSVPIRLKNGDVYGTFCCFSYTDDQSLNERDAGMMRVFADMVGKQLERENA